MTIFRVLRKRRSAGAGFGFGRPRAFGGPGVAGLYGRDARPGSLLLCSAAVIVALATASPAVAVEPASHLTLQTLQLPTHFS